MCELYSEFINSEILLIQLKARIKCPDKTKIENDFAVLKPPKNVCDFHSERHDLIITP